MDDAELLTLAARQHGAASDTQAFELGYSSRTIRRLVESGEWQRPLPRVLRCTGAPSTDRQGLMAATLWGGSEAHVSHTAAAFLWELDGVRDHRVEITVPSGTDLRSPHVRVHRTTNMLGVGHARIDGIPVTSVTRTLIDLAGQLSTSSLELAMEDAFRRRLTTPAQLARHLDQLGRRGRRGTGRMYALLDARGACAPTGSAAEVKLERLLVGGGLPRPERQCAVTHRGRTIYVDFAYPDRRLAIEFDSIRWHTGRARLDNDAERRNLLQAVGWELLVVTDTMVRREAARTLAVVRDSYLRRDVWGKTAKGWPEIPEPR